MASSTCSGQKRACRCSEDRPPASSKRPPRTGPGCAASLERNRLKSPPPATPPHQTPPPQQNVDKAAMTVGVAAIEGDGAFQLIESPVVVAEIDRGDAEDGVSARIELVYRDRLSGESLRALQR